MVEREMGRKKEDRVSLLALVSTSLGINEGGEILLLVFPIINLTRDRE